MKSNICKWLRSLNFKMKIPNYIALNLAYLQQISDLIEDKHKPLAAQYGYIAKKIALKSVVSIKGSDPPKSRRCKACQAPITCDNVKIKKKKIFASCSLCGYSRPVCRVSIKQQQQQPERQKPASAQACT